MLKNKIVIFTSVFAMFLLVPIGIKADNVEGGKFTISGYMKDKGTGEELLGSTIFVKELKTGTTTNLYGFYSLSLPEGTYHLVYSYVGFTNIEKTIELKENVTINIELEPANEMLKEVEITGKKANENVTSSEMSVIKMDAKTIKQIPAFMGEVDIIKAIQLQPGIAVISEGSSGFSVRGGSADQNLILLDEATVYNASHLMGFFSTFNNDAVKDVKVYKGDIPAGYGGRLASLVDVRMKEGNMKRYSSTGGIGLISGRATIEGPIVKDKSSFIISGRRSWVDLFFPLATNKNVQEMGLYFYDANAKINYIINENNRVFISSYFGRDQYTSNDFLSAFGNQTATIRWNHLFSKKIFSNFTGIYSKYHYEMGNTANTANNFTWKSRLMDFSAKADFTYYVNPNNTIKFGLMGTYHNFDPGSAYGGGDNAFFDEFTVPENNSVETGIFLGNEQKLNKFTLRYGIRFSSFHNRKGTIYNFDKSDPMDYVAIDSTVYEGDFFNTYAGLEPRLAMTYLINEKSSIKASYSRTRQYIQLAQNSTAGTPLDVWYSSSPNIKPQICDQVAIGYFRNFKNNAFETSVEIYYKEMDNTIDFRDHAELLLNREIEGEVRVGESTAFGAEFLVKKSKGDLTGWISYTISRAERKIPEINNGEVYLAPYDKPHNISVVMNYNFNKRISAGMNWVYSTGNPVTYPSGRFEYGNLIAPVYTDRNDFRMPDYHRLDLSFTFKGKEKGHKYKGHDWTISVYNAYNRKNAWIINFIQDEDNPSETYAEKTYMFAILPTITYNFHF